jgi:hypothetical protein
MNQSTFNENAILICDSRHGIYMPKLIAEEILTGNIKLKNFKEVTYELGELGNPENEFYWECWDDFMSKAILLDINGKEFYLHQDEDVWAVPVGESPYADDEES